MEWIKREEASRRLDSDSSTDTTCDGCHDIIRTPFWVFKYFLEIYQIYFPMDLESPPYLFGFIRNRQFTTEFFSAHGAVSPYFGPMDHVSS
jgi:hypothetical protein